MSDSPERLVTIIAGSRSFNDLDYSMFLDCLTKVPWTISKVCSGTARGIGRMGERWAREHEIPIRRFPADWSQGKSAGHARNQQMADYAEALVAVWDGQSTGTMDMVTRARARGLQVCLFRKVPMEKQVQQQAPGDEL